jgi:GntR family transcriptional regulator/MocR family aminotransferase
MARAQRELASERLILDLGSRQSLQEQIVRYFRNAIVSGQLRKGHPLPGSRRLARLQGVSRTTVMEAYQRLRAEGYVAARPRAGLFVADTLPEEFANATRSCPREAVPAPRASARSDESTRDPSFVPPQPGVATQGLAPGVPALDLFPWRVWNRISASLLGRRETRLFAWSDPRGEPALREAIAEYLGTLRGLSCDADQVIVGNGSHSLVERVLHVLTQPGDEVWFEEPGDPDSRAVLRAAGLDPVPVPVDEEGIDVAAGMRAAPRARLAIVAPSHHYPLGVTLSEARRRSLLAWAERAGAWIVENEIDGDYRFVRRPLESMYSMDRAGRVIFLGSFNKALAPGLRVGYLVVPPSLVDTLVSTAPPLSSPLVGVPQQMQLARFWHDGHLAAYLRQLREVHARRREALMAALRSEAEGVLNPVGPPEAGLRVPLRLETTLADGAIVEACRAQGLRVGRAMSSCYVGKPARNGFGIGFAATPEEMIAPAVRRLVEITRSH